MTKSERELKASRQRRRTQILAESYKKPLGENLCIYLGGVIQKGKL